MSSIRRSVTIRVLLVDGMPQGVRLVDRLDWTGVLLSFARADFSYGRGRDEAGRTGVYALIGPDPGGVRSQRVYVGEGEDVRTRLDSHQRSKDFWTHAYVLTSKDRSLNKAHVRYLEARLLELARAADNAVLDNETAPVLPQLGEHERSEMETYLDHALPLLSLLGVNVFEPIEEQAAVAPEAEPVQSSSPASSRLYLKTQLTEAEGEDQAEGFLVLRGALGRKEKKVMMGSYERIRDKLLDEGILVEDGKNVRLTRSYRFESPSAAASILSGGNKNGRTEWRDGSGRTLKQLQEDTAE